jgi:hypothetical protein
MLLATDRLTDCVMKHRDGTKNSSVMCVILPATTQYFAVLLLHMLYSDSQNQEWHARCSVTEL